MKLRQHRARLGSSSARRNSRTRRDVGLRSERGRQRSSITPSFSDRLSNNALSSVLPFAAFLNSPPSYPRRRGSVTRLLGSAERPLNNGSPAQCAIAQKAGRTTYMSRRGRKTISKHFRARAHRRSAWPPVSRAGRGSKRTSFRGGRALNARQRANQEKTSAQCPRVWIRL